MLNYHLIRINLFPYYSKNNSVELPQDITLAPCSTRVLTRIAKDQDKHLSRKETSLRLHENFFDSGIYNYHVYCSHDESNYPLMLNNPNPNSIVIKMGILGYTLLDCTQETTEMMTVIDNVVFIEFVKASDPEMNNNLQLCSTESDIHSSTEIHSRNKFSGRTVSHDELATDFSNEVKPLQLRIAKMARDDKRKQFDEKFFSEFSLLNQHFKKYIDFSKSYFTDSELQHLWRVLIENSDVFLRIT